MCLNESPCSLTQHMTRVDWLSANETNYRNWFNTQASLLTSTECYRLDSNLEEYIGIFWDIFDWMVEEANEKKKLE